jgi:DNA-binding PadR family transcriptional regulator
MQHMMNKETFGDLFDKSAQELRRGVLVLAILSQLHEPKYGYALINSLSAKGLQVEQGTLYPLLRRLEGQGLLESEWNVEGSRPRRYYVISTDGHEMLAALSNEWFELSRVMGKFLPGAPLVEQEQ